MYNSSNQRVIYTGFTTETSGLSTGALNVASYNTSGSMLACSIIRGSSIIVYGGTGATQPRVAMYSSGYLWFNTSTMPNDGTISGYSSGTVYRNGSGYLKIKV